MAVQKSKSIFCSRNHYIYFVTVKDIQNEVFSFNINILLITIADSTVSSFKIFKLKMGVGGLIVYNFKSWLLMTYIA